MPANLPPHRSRPKDAPLALAGLRVIDFSRMLAGPFATQQLADLGAEIVKVESPGHGDDSRNYMTTSLAGEGAFFLSTNRNKKSIALDLKNPAGRDIALKLIANADIVVENFSNGVMDRLGLGYDAVSASNPGLIYCSVSGYGRDDNGRIARRAYDGLLQASSGFMSLTGEADRMPMRTQVPVIDAMTALMATNAIVAAAYARTRLGQGQHIELSLVDVAMSALTLYGMTYLISGQETPRSGNRAPQTAPSDVYATASGPIFITCGNDRMFRRMVCEGLRRPDIADDPDFAHNRDRSANVLKLTARLQEIFKTNTQDHWVKTLTEIGVPVAPVATVGEAFASEDVTRRHILSGIPHPTAGTVPNVRSPYIMSLTPPADPVAPPLLGQHNKEILRDILALDDAQIAALDAAGAFGAD